MEAGVRYQEDEQKMVWMKSQVFIVWGGERGAELEVQDGITDKEG